MLYRYFITSFLFSILLTSCDRGSTNTVTQHSTKETVDNNFNDFIEKYSSDTSFQVSRTKFPLKIKWYDIDNDKDTLIYEDRLGFKMMDFRKQRSTGEYDQWEQRIVVDKNSTSATIEIRGIENGIVVDYFFEKINGMWMLVEINDSST